jgi:hypothetical protein
LLDALAATLCLWAACYHTPAGALVRTAGGWLFHVQATTRPLLAYYSAGVYDEAASGPAQVLVPTHPGARGPVPPQQALGYGVFAELASLGPEGRAPVEAFADAHGCARARLADPHEGPAALTRLIDGLATDLGSPEVAVAALFWGEEPARFARDRARAVGHAPDLEAMAHALPPGFGDRVAAASRALTMGTAYALAWPVPEGTRVTSPFGMRTHPVLGVQKLHTGVDLSVPVGTEVRVTAGGVVRRASEDSVNGKVVIIDHGRGVTTAYCHNSELLVTAGQRVAPGQVLSRSGNTGRSTGPHLHYQLEFGGTPVDPLAYRMGTEARGDESLAAGD